MEEAELEQLVRKAAAGDEAAKVAVLEEHQRLLLVKATEERKRKKLAVGTSAEIYQEVSIEILRSLGNHEWRDAAYFRGWLALVTKGKASDIAKREGAKKRGGGLEKVLVDENKPPYFDVNYRPSQMTLERQEKLRDVLQEAKAHLEPLPAMVVTMQLNGWTTDELADVLGKSPDAVRKISERAVQKLVERLAS